MTGKEAALVAARITRALSHSPLQHADLFLNLTASIGIASSGLGVSDPATLLEQADQALYETKRRGRNGYTNAFSNLEGCEARQRERSMPYGTRSVL
jgi:diguanylate cyclase (GGDEF)-like protein